MNRQCRFVTTQASMNKNWLVRSASGVIYIAVIVLGILLGAWYFLAMSLVLAIPAVMEYKRLTVDGRESSFNTLLDVAGATFIVSWPFSGWNVTLAWLILAYLVARLVLELYTNDANPRQSLTSSLSAMMYVAVPIALMSVIMERTTPQVLLAMFVLIWVNDTGAFVVGSLMGKHRLFPRHSPNKSWEGWFGGLVLSVGVALLMLAIFPEYFLPNVWAMIGFAATVVVFSTWGDLVESLLKRSAGVKDSGNLIPGHGGMLDRIDSLLLVAPAVTLYIRLIL